MRRLIFKMYLSPGDEVMMTAALRDLHIAYRGQFQTDVRTPSKSLWENNPYITPLKEGDPGVEVIDMQYPFKGRGLTQSRSTGIGSVPLSCP